MIHRNVLKIISVLMAIGLWFYVLNSGPGEEELNVALEYQLPEGKSFAAAPPRQVQLRLRGPRAFLRTLREREQAMRVDLNSFRHSQRHPGSYHIELSERLLALPLGVSIAEYEFQTLRLTLAPSTIREIPIQLDLRGAVREKFQLMHQEVFPPRLKLRGAEVLLAGLSRVQTRPVELSSLEGEGEVALAFVGLPDHLQVVGEGEAVFRYRIGAVAATSNFSLQDVPIRFLSSRRVVQSSHRKGTLFVLVDDEDIRLRKQQVQIIADIPNSADGRIPVKLTAKLIPGVHLIRISPPEITVTVR